MRYYNTLHVCLFIICILLLFIFSCSKEKSIITIPLKINHNFLQKAHTSWITFEIDEEVKRKYQLAPDVNVGYAPGKIIITAKKIEKPDFAYKLKIDCNADGILSNEQEYILQLDSTVQINILRKYQNNKSNILKYVIKYSRFKNRTGGFDDILYWVTHYRTEGFISNKDSSNLIAFLDFSGNGIFNDNDFACGTTLCIDMNGDKKIWGRNEWKHGYQIFTYQNENYMLDELAEDGTFVTFLKSDIIIPKIGDDLPLFTLKTTQGEVIRSTELKGKIYIIDFWDSGCIPCIKRFPILQEIEKKHKGLIQVISVNVDDAKYLKKANKIIDEYHLDWPHVMNGLGKKDHVWRMFGSMSDNRMGTPLYLVIDQNRKIKYADSGGMELMHLKKSINDLIN